MLKDSKARGARSQACEFHKMDRKKAPRAIRTSRRHPCPIDINCELVAAERGKTCPNRNYCKSVAAPWEFPYNRSTLPDGTEVLIVSFSFLSPYRATYQEAGWYASQELPYFYAVLPEDNKPMLVVAIDPIGHGAKKIIECGWQNAEDLTDDFYIAYWFYRIEIPKCNRPHCILPPNY
ncbi:hypothetical protein [Aliterella atlantica]|uniref:hypothetical protein n=1 Tax=Aliterella atlantica TaxID=1827278 RepID=UPI001184C1C2|nr:hypothetical protein [Aliterella atlantica]